jgi:small ubiquitin-related modifier|eukprot:CAMPEP_0173150152 /NCGR_PEP_ID=MMETSP1105-20130129/10779_1 /TAXON_ID=2985 /ORGANISM="Ochromonas sp., Strain BG-1" /LENGTH=210 /DNA_ID=CAMNT_0014065211 /DNA_START=52 /DNA_END=684 /DNA_ORIENTATION=-
MSFRFYNSDGERVKYSCNEENVEKFVGQVGGGGDEEEDTPKGDAPITLKVRDQAGEVMFFKVKKSTEMRKIFDAYAQRLGVNSRNLKFTLDGERLKDTDTPKMLELTDEDQIDVFLDQVGGSGEDVKPEDSAITLRVREGTGEETAFKVKKSTKMSKIFETFASRKGLSVNMIRFMYDGQRIKAEDTPKMLEMEDDDQIDVVLQQEGGRL